MDLKIVTAPLKKLWVEALLLGLALLISVISLFVYFGSQKEDIVPVEIKKSAPAPGRKLAVEISGAVINPGVYDLKDGSRLNDLLDKAGGLSTGADKDFFARNFNLSRLVGDQEKVYIPSRQEVLSGLFVEQAKTVDFVSGSQPISQTSQSSGKISLNNASSTELDSLPGVGKVTAEKIISLRPYANVDELLNKKAVSQNVFNQIKDLVSLN